MTRLTDSGLVQPGRGATRYTCIIRPPNAALDPRGAPSCRSLGLQAAVASELRQPTNGTFMHETKQCDLFACKRRASQLTTQRQCGREICLLSSSSSSTSTSIQPTFLSACRPALAGCSGRVGCSLASVARPAPARLPVWFNVMAGGAQQHTAPDRLLHTYHLTSSSFQLAVM
jgi:hypothetical protein